MRWNYVGSVDYKGLDPVGVEKHGFYSHTFSHTGIHTNTFIRKSTHMAVQYSMSETLTH